MLSIAQEIEHLLDQNIQPNRIAILCRSNSQCNKQTIILQANRIPVFSTNSMGAPIAEQLISLLKVLHKGLCIPECCDIFRLGNHKIPKKLVQGVLPPKAKRESIPTILQTIRMREPTSPLGILLNQFFAPLEKARSHLGKKPLSEVLRSLFVHMNLIDHSQSSEPTQLGTISEEILTMSMHFNNSLIPLPSLISEVETRQKGFVGKHNNVNILTIHRAKGLEFDYVFIPSIQPGIFPPKSALYEHRVLEEERRLLYVAMTRTKKKLYLSRYRRSEELPWNGFLDECFDPIVQKQST